MTAAAAEDPNARLRAEGDRPIPLFPVVTHYAVIERPRHHVDPGTRDSAWHLHPLYADWPGPVRDTVQMIADAAEPLFCFNCAKPVGYREVGTLAQSWYPVHLIHAAEDPEVTVTCPGCAVPF